MDCKNRLTFVLCKMFHGKSLQATLQNPINPDSQTQQR